MKLKQVTFAEALEHMKAGKYARLNGCDYIIEGNVVMSLPYRAPACARFCDVVAGQWFIEVEPMKYIYETGTSTTRRMPDHQLPDGWELKRVRVTVEEI